MNVRSEVRVQLPILTHGADTIRGQNLLDGPDYLVVACCVCLSNVVVTVHQVMNRSHPDDGAPEEETT